MRWLPQISALFAVFAIATGIFWGSFGYFQSEEQSKAEGRLSLYRSSLIAELQRFSHLTHILARDPYVVEISAGGDTGFLNNRFKDFVAATGLDSIYLMNADGVTIAASNAGTPTSFVGQVYSFRPYFLSAMKGEQGHFYGIGATTGQPGYFLADAVKDEDGTILGVLAIKIVLSKVQERWRDAGEKILLTNRSGVVLLASEPDWRFRVLDPLTDKQKERIRLSRQFPGQDLEPLNWQQHLHPEPSRATIDGMSSLYLFSSDLPHDWSLHYFASDDRAVARSMLVTGFGIMIAAAILILFQLQRTRRIGAALKRSEEEEALLRQANERLAVEISERRTAEQALQKTQDELERASRLAALGRLAALVTHELGQPIAAMRNYVAAAEISGTSNLSSTLSTRIGGLVDRMEDITRQLKFFARTDEENFEDVDLRDAMQISLGLVEPNLKESGVLVHFSPPVEPILVRGSRFRLEQTMTNLLRNAIDACEEVDDPTMTIAMGRTRHTVWFEIIDNGHGLGGTSLKELQEPFVTTRESGRGMGLGLAISAGIVNDHDGQMSAWDRPEGGAVFRVELHALETAWPIKDDRAVGALQEHPSDEVGEDRDA
ncbi:sensor histidine kinase [Cohaesibacter intestini]|uniref:sensor histidine kinase n=1 Tax=Cohaesibacter intestini TaxID=2211145 RepID=UPI000DEB4C9C|nr:ATP-binding protein [Cohaesibacter intestini]